METIYNETSLPSLRVKSIIQDKATGSTFRVLFLSSENTLSLQNGYWIQINEPKNTPNGTFDDMVEHARSTYLFCPNLCTQLNNGVITRKLYIDTSKIYRYNSG